MRKRIFDELTGPKSSGPPEVGIISYAGKGQAESTLVPGKQKPLSSKSSNKESEIAVIAPPPRRLYASTSAPEAVSLDFFAEYHRDPSIPKL